jgi:hypothetical protein
MREGRGGPQLNAMQGCAAFEGNSRGALVKLVSAPLSISERLELPALRRILPESGG